jgi:hypothetical protein
VAGRANGPGARRANGPVTAMLATAGDISYVAEFTHAPVLLGQWGTCGR